MTATRFAKEKGYNCVTIDGDQVNRKGALTGGFYDVRTSRLDAMKNIKHWREKAKTTNSEHEKIKKENEALDQEISNILGEIQKNESERSAARGFYENEIQVHKQLSRELQASKELITQTVSEISTTFLMQSRNKLCPIWKLLRNN